MLKLLIRLHRVIFARRAFERVNLHLLRLSLRGLGVLNYQDSEVSGEKHLLETIIPRIQRSEKPIFFDIGANIGDYSIALSSGFPGATIHAFEPHPDNLSRLESRHCPENIVIHHAAVGASEGKVTLYDRSDTQISSHATLHQQVITEIHKKKVNSYIVDMISLDDFCERSGISHIDFIKIDTEGNELAVLKGAKRLIEEERISAIHFEFNEMNIISRVFFRDFRKHLANYQLYRLLPNDLLPLGDSPLQTEIFAYQNILALVKDSVTQ